jgi:hypothetical protein
VLALVLALPARLWDLGSFLTTDEIFWVGRSARFVRALDSGDLARTLQSGHPGVPTMWLAALGARPSRIEPVGGSRGQLSRSEVTSHGEFMEVLAASRSGFAVASSVMIALLAAIACGLFGTPVGLLSAVLLALDPFLLAHSRLVHIDATLALLSSVALFAGLRRWAGGDRGWLVLSAVAAGLAMLCKAPALLTVAVVPIASLGLQGWRRLGQAGWWLEMAMWGAIALAAYVVAWPAMWVAPLATLGAVLEFVRDNSSLSSREPVIDTGYYAWTLLLRTSPLSLVGLMAALAVVRPTRGAATFLLIFALGFGVAMTIGAKYADRYLLPIFPPIDVLAAIGICRAIVRVRWRLVGIIAFGMIALWTAHGIWESRPYFTTYANPALGGQPVAATRLGHGWGEGLDQVAATLNRRPNADRLVVAMPDEIYTTVLDAQFRGRVGPSSGADATAYDYLVVYARSFALARRPEYFDDRYLGWTPDQVVRIGGVDYAWVYETRRGAPVGVLFSDGTLLERYSVDSAIARRGRPLEVRLRWRVGHSSSDGRRVSVALVGGAGPIAEAEAPLEDRPNVETSLQLSVAGDAAAGRTQLVVRLLGRDGRAIVAAAPTFPGREPQPFADAVVTRDIDVR